MARLLVVLALVLAAAAALVLAGDRPESDESDVPLRARTSSDPAVDDPDLAQPASREEEREAASMTADGEGTDRADAEGVDGSQSSEPAVEMPWTSREQIELEIARLDVERKALYRSLSPHTRDAYHAAFERGDYREVESTSKIDTEGKLVSVRHLPDGRLHVVELPRVGNEVAYSILDEMDGKRERIHELRVILSRQFR